MKAQLTKLKAANLWQKTSASGNVYFTGRMGGVKILIFANRDQASENDPTHTLFFVDGSDQAKPSPAIGAPLRSYSRRRESARPAADAGDAMPDDRLDDLRFGGQS